MVEASTEDEAPPPPAFYPPPTFVCTEAYADFLKEYRANIDYFMFIAYMAANADKAMAAVSQALAIVSNDPEAKARYERHLKEPDRTFRTLRRYSVLTSQNLTNGVVNAFQRYFSTLIQKAALKRPQIMASAKEQVRVDDVLRFSRHRDLVRYVVDRKINALSYGGLEELERYYDERLGVQMFQNERQKSLLRLFIEARNINVHNGGRVNEIFAQRVGNVDGFPYTQGELFQIDFDDLITLATNAMTVAQAMDATISSKFDMRRKTVASWGKEGAGKVASPAPPAVVS